MTICRKEHKVSLKIFLATITLITLLFTLSLVYVRSANLSLIADFYEYPPFATAKYVCTPWNTTHYVARNMTTGNYDITSTNGTATINYAASHLTASRQGQDEIYVTGSWNLDGSIVLYNYTKLTLNAHLTETKGAHSAISIEGTASAHKQYITVSGGNVTCITSTYEGLDVSYADYVLVEDMRIIGANGGNRDGIRISYTTESTFRHNYMKHNDYEWYIVDGTQNCLFEGNYGIQLTAQPAVSLWRVATYGSTHNVSGNEFIGNWAIGTYGEDCDNGFYLRSYADNAQVVHNLFIGNHIINITGIGRAAFKLNPACYNTFRDNYCYNVETGYRFEINQATTLTVERTSYNTISGGAVYLYKNPNTGAASNKGVVFSSQDENAQVCYNLVSNLLVTAGNGTVNDYGIQFDSDADTGQTVNYNVVSGCLFQDLNYTLYWTLNPVGDAQYNMVFGNYWMGCTNNATGTAGTNTRFHDNIATNGGWYPET